VVKAVLNSTDSEGGKVSARPTTRKTRGTGGPMLWFEFESRQGTYKHVNNLKRIR
jgi:hypothetical protein